MLAASAWSLLISHNWQRVEALSWQPLPNPCADAAAPPFYLYSCFIAADPVEYGEYFRNYPSSLRELRSANPAELWEQIRGWDSFKRPLFGPTTAAVNLLVSEATGMTLPRRMVVVLALYASLCSLLFFRLLRMVEVRASSAALLTVIATASFGWLAVFSIPESYSLTVSGALLSMISGVALERSNPRRLWLTIVGHCVLTGVMAWLYAPICGAVFMLLGRRWKSSREALIVLAPSVVLTCLIASIPLGLGGFAPTKGYLGSWSGFHNLLDLTRWRDVTASFLVFGIISPVEDFRYSSGRLDWTILVSRPIVGVAVLAVVVLYVIWIVCARRPASRRHLYGPAVWFVLLLAFHVYFNPSEVLLYLSLPLMLVMYAVGCAIRDVDLVGGYGSRVTVGLVVAVVALLGLNWSTVFGWPA